MVSTTPGIGQAYLGAYKDKNDKWFDGGKTYKLTVPANPPAKQFWSLTIYDTYDRVGIDNKTQNADIASRDEGLRKNPDGSVDLYVGPSAPAGYEKNWRRPIPARRGSRTSGSTGRWSLISTGAGSCRTSRWSISSPRAGASS
jgi:hypothetical protein